MEAPSNPSLSTVSSGDEPIGNPRPGKCEGCGNPATRLTTDGYDVCESCFNEIPHEPWEYDAGDLAADIGKARALCKNGFGDGPLHLVVFLADKLDTATLRAEELEKLVMQWVDEVTTDHERLEIQKPEYTSATDVLIRHGMELLLSHKKKFAGQFSRSEP